ncbi:zinc transport system substrate-binding protein [Neorhizobium galegae]|uniref:zinc ABC transporter substrate-binding protein ZnuA n=1 Tax=Neorhizobium galegae TaxID=399 RepID=UPI001AE26F63|nr:zinc ABC transporter substrate-binding protein ZnuA [Neorhizobium galegae]MBP2549235.1 zinc transport system substrate-binding protein [Neorhizobium galegae]
MKSVTAALLASATLFAAADAMAAPQVVVSIKPIHSLVAAVMEGVGEPKLIVEGAASPHTYTMKPSNARAIQDADLVFWIGPNMEAFLDKPLDALSKSATVVALGDAPGLQKLPFREGGAFEAHDDGDEHEAHEAGDHGAEHAEAHDDHAGEDAHQHEAHEAHAEHGHAHSHEGFDTHMWLDPMNAKAMAKEIEAKLIAVDPENIAVYNKNTLALLKKIDALDADLKATVEPVKDKPFVVFHDAYQYFEHRYDIRVAGSITVSPETAPGAERLSDIHKKLVELGAACVFAEPQFTPKLIKVVTEGTKARAGVLDPEGASLKEGPELYFQLMHNLGNALNECLSRDS